MTDPQIAEAVAAALAQERREVAGRAEEGRRGRRETADEVAVALKEERDQVASETAADLEAERQEVAAQAAARLERERLEAADAAAAEVEKQRREAAEHLEREQQEAAASLAKTLEQFRNEQAERTAAYLERDRQAAATSTALDLERDHRDSASTLARWQGTTDSHLRENSRRLDGLNGSIAHMEKDLTAVKVILASLKTRVAVGAGFAALAGSGVVAVIANALGGSP